MTYLESAINERDSLRQKIKELEQDLETERRACNIRDGKIEDLEKKYQEATSRGDHYLKWNAEITRQLHNIGMFVREALLIAKQEVENTTDGQKLASQIEEVKRNLEETLQ